jgi:glucose-6-phosphate 1-dehydrogenase
VVPQRIYYVRGDFQDPEAYKALKEQIAEGGKNPQRAGEPFLLPGGRAAIFRRSGAATRRGRAGAGGQWPLGRVIIEKPFGRDLDSARALNREIKQILEEADLSASIITWARRRCRTS